MLLKTITVIAITLSFQSWGASSIKTKSHKKGVYVSDATTMKTWLKKMPQAIKEVHSANVNITGIDVKWKQKKIAHKARKSKGRSPSYSCTLHLTIKFEDVSNGESAPSQVASPDPLTVNSRCDTFLARHNLEAIIKSNTNS
ncbi:MAG: hypothetical protein R3A80_08735 [Bdellovibrionota bacterium]